MSWVVAVVVGFVCVYYCVWFISSVAFNVVSQTIGGWGESGRSGSLAFVSSGWKAVCLPLSP